MANIGSGTSDSGPSPFQLYFQLTSTFLLSRCFDACLVIDGSLSYKFNDGTRATIEIHNDDALRTIQMRWRRRRVDNVVNDVNDVFTLDIVVFETSCGERFRNCYFSILLTSAPIAIEPENCPERYQLLPLVEESPSETCVAAKRNRKKIFYHNVVFNPIGEPYADHLEHSAFKTSTTANQFKRSYSHKELCQDLCQTLIFHHFFLLRNWQPLVAEVNARIEPNHSQSTSEGQF